MKQDAVDILSLVFEGLDALRGLSYVVKLVCGFDGEIVQRVGFELGREQDIRPQSGYLGHADAQTTLQTGTKNQAYSLEPCAYSKNRFVDSLHPLELLDLA
jgi:hypothetical protein